MKNKIHIYYGYGKGKTTAATGLAIRALSSGFKVAIIYFDKGHNDEEHYSERKILRHLDGCEIFPTGCERVMKNGKFRFGVKEKDILEAKRGLDLAYNILNKNNINLLVLDEILAAVAFKLLVKEDLLNFLKEYNKNRPFELVLTGHEIWDGLIDLVDLVTEIKKVKHYFDEGQEARKGIEF